MEPKVSYTLVGLFVVVLGAGLLSVVLWLGQEGQDKVYDQYAIYMRESVSGLSENAPVKYRGVEVGRVREIGLDPDNPQRVHLLVEIARGTPLKADTVATLSSQGLTGLAFVDLSGGTRDAPPLQAAEGERYPVIRSRPSLLVRMDEAVSNLLMNLNVIAVDLRELVDADTRVSIKALLTNLAHLSETLVAREGQIDQALVSAGRAVRNIEQVSAQVSMLVARLTGSIEALQHLTQDIAHTSRAVTTLVTENRHSIGRFTQQTLTDVGLLVNEFRQLTVSLEELARRLEQEPSALLFGGRPVAPGPGE